MVKMVHNEIGVIFSQHARTQRVFVPFCEIATNSFFDQIKQINLQNNTKEDYVWADMLGFYISGGEVNELGSVLMELGVMFFVVFSELREEK